ncbi:MAG: hypothetical protein K6U78_13500 [Anaerolineae bacterium]|nr:hypothetical protein [Anaerolineae bacterium]
MQRGDLKSFIVPVEQGDNHMEGITGGLASIALGAALLLFGKNLRLFGAAAGFFIGFVLTQQLFPGTSVLLTLILSAALALGGAILVILARSSLQLFIQVVGAVAGAAVVLWLLQSLGIASGLAAWIIALVGAFVSFGLMARFYNLGIVILTALVGAGLIVKGVGTLIPLGDGVGTVLTLALAAGGFFYQRNR